MRLHADAVAGAVHEVLAVAGRRDDVARRRVDGLARSRPAGRARRRRAGPRAGPRSSRGTRRAASPTDVHAGAVRAVALGVVPPMSTTTGVAALEHPVADLVVRAGAVGPGADDGEVDGRRGPPGSRRRCRGRPPARCGRAAATRPSGRAPGRSPRRPRAARRPRRATCASAVRRSTAAGQALLAPGSAAGTRSTCSAHIRLASPTAPTAGRRRPATSGVRVVGLARARRSRSRRPGPARPAPRGAPGRARPGTARPRPAATRQVSRSSGSAS